MPSKIVRKKPYKRRYKRRRYSYRPRIGKRIPTGIPSKMQLRLKYADNFALDPAVSDVPVFHQFNCNGLYDINQDATGHQCRYFDQFMAMYQHYTVTSSICKVTPISDNFPADGLDSANVIPMMYGIMINAGTDECDNYITMYSILESKQLASKWNVISEANVGTDHGPNANNKTVTAKWSLAKYFGKTNISSPNYRGTAGANPTETSLFSVWGVYPTNLGEPQLFIIELEFNVVLTEVKYVAPS